MHFLPKALEDYLHQHSTHPEPKAILQELAEYTATHTSMPQMLTGPLEGMWLQLMTRIVGAQRIVEIGTFTGHSALCMAAAMEGVWRLVTFEISEAYAHIAREFWRRTPYQHRIHLHLGNAVHLLSSIKGPIDLAFVDADKPNYPRYFKLLKPKMRKRGIILFDNALWSGRVTAPDDKDSHGIHQMNELVTTDPDVMNVLVPLRDGIQMVIIQ